MDQGLLFTLLLYALLLCFCLETASTQRTGNLPVYKISSFQNPDSSAKLNHVLLHSLSGNVYVGAVNSIYRLDNNLEHQRNASTSNGCDGELNCVNYNKVIFVEPLRNALITCGSYTGTCQLRHVEELTVTAEIENVVASDEDKTTVGILAPGPGNKDWLYVAATYTTDLLRNQVPPVSRRILDLVVPNDRLLFASEKSQVNFNSDYKSRPFDISYIYGFSSNGYVYYVTAQQIGGTGFVSKVVRVCHQVDVLESARPDLDAYTEITIQCGQGSLLAQAAHVGPAGPGIAASLGIDSSDLMLYAVFTEDDSSALCMFSMSDIEEAFYTAVDNCINGGDSVRYLEGNRCRPTTLHFGDATPYLCEANSLYKYANNLNAVASTPLLERTGTKMSSIVTSTEMSHTVAFIGTSSGSLLKVHIRNGTSARHYETIKLGDDPVLRDVSLDGAKQQIVVLTEQQLLKLRIENCGQYVSCDECIGDNGVQNRDPYCGWCTLNYRCTKRSECPMANESTHWLPYNVTRCVAVIDIDPYRNLPVTTPQRANNTKIQITLTVEQLPELPDGETYSCQFDNLPMIQGTTVGNTVACDILEISARPIIPATVDHVTMQLSVFSSESMISFVSTGFSFYECNRHDKCGECVKSAWNCDWCVFDNTCTHRSTDCAAGDTIVTGLNNPDPGVNQGPGFCPQLQAQDVEVLVPVDITREILVNVSNLPDSNRVNYECSLMVENKRQQVQAIKISNDVIKCNGRRYTYAADDTNEVIVQLFVSWNGDRELDDYYRFSVTLYKCDVDRRDCSRCLSTETARPELECRWCGTQCAHREHRACSNSVLGPGGQCPAPRLEKVIPATGPLEGNTIIAIKGTNIGQKFQDVQVVTIGNKQCDLTGLEGQYVTGQSVNCRTAPMSPDTTHSITILVARVDGAENVQSTGTVMFTYTNPVITSFRPKFGPAAGGTLLSIYGMNINTGRDIIAMIGANIPVACDIISNSASVLRCYTGPSTVGNVGVVSVTFDGAVRNSSESFVYQPNPEIIDVQPRRSIEAGGRIIVVSGAHLTASNASVFVRNGESSIEYRESCHMRSNSTMVCTTPAIELPGTMTSPCTDVALGFMLDGFQMLLNTTGIGFSYCLNPVVHKFEGENNEYAVGNFFSIFIQGERFALAATKSEVKVTVGNKNCTIVNLIDAYITCELPDELPSGLDEQGRVDSDETPTATVTWYGRFVLSPGTVVFPFKYTYLTMLLLTSSSAIAAFLIFLSIVFAVKYYKQKRLLKDYNKRLVTRIRDFHEEMLEIVENQRKASTPVRKLLLNRRAKRHQKSIYVSNEISIVPEDLQIKFNQLEFGRVLGRGAFGEVFEAVLSESTNGPHRTVAVKTIQDENSDPGNIIKFLEEGLLMKSFDHPNVLGLLGLTFDSKGQPFVVLPFMANGDLKSFFLNQPQGLTTGRLVIFALHIALGMEYLARRKFVHRDLAARNCMVDKELNVKIADFGLCRDLYEDDYYTSNDKQAKLPIKWMAPESMERKVFNTRTDVWSYGVVLWELFSVGRKPYPGIKNEDVYDYLQRGERMVAPPCTPWKIYKIMQNCWNVLPKRRWSFRQIVAAVKETMASPSEGLSPPDRTAHYSTAHHRAQRDQISMKLMGSVNDVGLASTGYDVGFSPTDCDGACVSNETKAADKLATRMPNRRKPDYINVANVV